jgi:hypothetical protein
MLDATNEARTAYHGSFYAARDFGKFLFEQEGPGILAWAIEGAQMVLREMSDYGDITLTSPQEGCVDNLLAESESMELFVREYVARAAGHDLTKDELMEEYAEFCSFRSWEAIPLPVQRSKLPELMLRHHSVGESHSVQRSSSGGESPKGQRGYRNVELTPWKNEP